MDRALIARLWPRPVWGLVLAACLGAGLLHTLGGFVRWMWLRPGSLDGFRLTWDYVVSLMGLGLPPLALFEQAAAHPDQWWAALLASLLTFFEEGIVFYLLPGVVAWRVGELRRDGTLGRLCEAGRTPGRVLAEVGAAVCAPLLAAAVLRVLFTLLLAIALPSQFPERAGLAGILPFRAETWLGELLLLMVNCAVILPLGFLGSGKWGALQLCYLGGLGLRIVFFYALSGWPLAIADRDLRGMLMTAAFWGVRLLAIALLIGPALAAIQSAPTASEWDVTGGSAPESPG